MKTITIHYNSDAYMRFTCDDADAERFVNVSCNAIHNKSYIVINQPKTIINASYVRQIDVDDLEEIK